MNQLYWALPCVWAVGVLILLVLDGLLFMGDVKRAAALAIFWPLLAALLVVVVTVLGACWLWVERRRRVTRR